MTLRTQRRTAAAVLLCALALIAAASALAATTGAVNDSVQVESAPVIDVSGDRSATAGVPYALDIALDGIDAEAVSSWSVGWGDGAWETGAGVPPASITHTYERSAGPHGITFGITMSDGTFHTNARLIVAEYERFGAPSEVRLNEPSSRVAFDDASTASLSTRSLVATSDQSIVFVDDASGTLMRLRLDGTSPAVVRLDQGSHEGAVDIIKAGPNRLLVANATKNTVERLTTGDIVTTDAFLDPGHLRGVSGMVIGLDRALYVADPVDDDIERFDLDSGEYLGRFAALSPGASPTGLALGPDGAIAASLEGTGEVVLLAPDGSIDALTDALSAPSDLERGPDGALWVTDRWNDELVRVDPRTGEIQGDLQSYELRGPTRLAFTPDFLVEVLPPPESPDLPAAIASSPDGELTAEEWVDTLDDAVTEAADELIFVANDGDADPDLDFVAQAGDYAAVISDDAVDVILSPETTDDVVTMVLKDSAESNPSAASTDSRVAFTDVYDGIDAIYSDDDGELEYSFIIEPGADPDLITLDFEGDNAIRLTDAGDLYIDSATGPDLVSTAPFTYQFIDGRRLQVPSAYQLRDDGTIGFELGSYDTTRPVVIDPTLTPATRMVMVTGSGGLSDARDAERSAFYTALGYTVTVIGGNDAQTVFDDAATANDVMLITATAGSTAAGTRARGLDIGILTESVGAFGDLLYGGFSFSSTTTSTLDVVDNSHYVTSPLGTGNTSFFSPGQSDLAWDSSGTALPSGAQVLVQRSTSARSLIVVDTGAALYSSNTATNRRVFLPSYDTPTSSWTTTMDTVVERAAAWGTGQEYTNALTVNSTADVVDTNPGDGSCDTGNTVGSAPECTVRAAIQESNALAGEQTIVIPAGTYTRTISGSGDDTSASGDLDINDSVTITGAGNGVVTIDANSLDRVFEVRSGTLSISGMTVTGGSIGSVGGGFFVQAAATANLTAVIIEGNTAIGGGVTTDGTLVVADSLISGNTSTGDGGGVHVRGSSGSANLTNVTVSGNIASGSGGAIFNNDTVVLMNSTITDNSAGTTGGIDDNAAITLRNTIVAGNTGGSNPDVDGTFTSSGYNIIGVDGTSTGWLGSDLLDTDPQLSGLADNGGPTQTHAIGATSPAIDAGTAVGAPSVDQRGTARPLDGDGDTTAAHDIGAFEYDPGSDGGGGGTNLVMVTGNGAFTGGNDAAKQALFQGWGWTVSAIDDNSSTGVFTTAAASNDVLFYSDTASAVAASNLRSLDIGIVSESYAGWDTLLYSGSSNQAWNNNTTIDIVDNTHYITSAFSTGTLTIHTGADDVNYWDAGASALPVGVTSLADSPTSTNHVALHVADTGGSLYSANTAVNRRVWFPSDAASPSVFTTDYETLLERSLDWAAGNDVAPSCSLDSDADGLWDCEEDANTDADDDPATNPGPDTDGDTTPNYLDADDDGDGTPTTSENADPNGDGDPRDALDTDRDGQPDYLDAPTVASNGTVADEQLISETDGGLTTSLGVSDHFGRSAAPIGDLDRDGINDIAVGVPNDDDGSSDRGAVFILFMNADGTVKSEQKISDTLGGFTATLDNADQFGIGVTGLGDLDGDGINDIAVGAHQDDDGANGNGGAIYVLFLNADGTVKSHQKISETDGGLGVLFAANDRFGSSVANVGDLDGDGLNDIVVGAKDDDDGFANAGAVYVVFLNEDGTAKAHQKISQTTGGLTGSPLGGSDGFGIGVAGLGDVDGDGTPDIAVGSYWDDDGGTNHGAAYVLFLNSSGTVKAQQKISDTTGGLSAALASNDEFGTSVGALGDVDADGVPDLVVGVPKDDDGNSLSGSAFVLFLNSDGTVKAEQKISNLEGGLGLTINSSDQFGFAVTGLGDLDGDGTIGLAVGSYGDDDGFVDSGSVYILDLSGLGSTISGTVFEDIMGDVLDDGVVGDADNPGAENVDVYLYLDDGDSNLDGGDTLVGAAPLQTDSSGDYSFTGLADGDYFVVVDSKTVASSVDPTATQGEIWAEQTWGPIGGYCDNGLVGFQIRIAAGPCYGGITDSISDDFSQWDDHEHRSYLTVAGGDVTNVDFGFSFNVVTTISGGNAADHDTSNPRTVQGSFRQFIQNANAISGSNTMRHVPASGPGLGGAWRIVVTNALPALTDPNTTIDGRTFDLVDGTTVLDGNAGFLGANSAGGATVGTDDVPLPQVAAPELEIRGVGVTDAGLEVRADDTTIRRLAIYGFGDAGENLTDGDIEVPSGTSVGGLVVEDNVIGSGATAFSDPGAGNRSGGSGVAISDGTGTQSTIQNNLFGWHDELGVSILSSNTVVVNGNEVRDAGQGGNIYTDALSAEAGSTAVTFSGNLVDGAPGNGISTWQAAGANAITNNSITNVGTGGAQTAGIAVFGGSSTVEKNVISGSTGPGVAVVGTNPPGGPYSWSASIGNRISQNTFGANGGLAIDLTASSDTESDHEQGDGVTLTPGTLASTGNIGLDAPVITVVTPTMAAGTACANCDVELYRAVAGSGDDDSGTDYGEGVEYLATTTADGTGNWSASGLSALSVGDSVSALAIDGSNNTSEFGANSTIDEFVVNSTEDAPDTNPGDGVCSTGNLNSAGQTECTLRAVIQETNAHAGPDVVDFDIPVSEAGHSAGIWTIQPSSFLGFITDEVTLDASTQPGFASDPIIELDGTAASGATAGLSLRTDNSEIRGFIVHSFDDDGLEIDGQTGFGDDNVIAGNWVGIDAAGVARPNLDAGIVVALGAANNTVGGTGPLDHNVIGSNTTAGIQLREATTLGNDITGNYIGVLDDGTTARPNGTHGIQIHVGSTGNRIGGTSAAEANVIVDNSSAGVVLTADAGADNSILRNSIHSNSGLGIDLADDGVTANSGADVWLDHPTITAASETGGTVTVDFELDVPAGNYRIEAFTNPGGSDPTGYGEGQTFQTATAINHTGSGTEAFQLTYAGNAGDVIALATTEDFGSGNYGSTSEFSATAVALAPTLVVNSTGDAADAVPGNGSCDTGGTNSQGATACTLRAAIEEANALAGSDVIEFDIPTTESGYSASPLAYTISPTSGYADIVDQVDIDATTQSGFSGDPIIQLDGSSASGATAGLVLETDDSSIRGFIVHSFADEGLEIDASTGGGQRNTIANNWVGVDVDGAAAGNTDVGILVTVGAADNIVENNVVSSNGNSGLVIRNSGSDDNVIRSNIVGFAPDGVTPRPNTSHGIEIYDGAASNVIGGPNSGDENVVAENSASGIVVQSTAGTDNTILRNALYSNTALGIDLGNDGVTSNSGADAWLDHPTITKATEAGGIVTVDFDLDIPAGTYRIETFTNPSGADASGFGEGEAFASSTTINHTGSGTEGFQLTFSGSAGDIVTLTTTEDLGGGSYGSTSEFSASFTALVADTATVNSTGDAADATPGDDICDTGSTNSAGDPECTLRAAIEEANASTIIDTINFIVPATETGHSGGVWTISPSTPLPSVTTTTEIDATTQTGWTSTPVIELDGSSAGSGADGVRVFGDATVVRGLAINRFDGDGVKVYSGTSGVLIESNHIGLDASGLIDRGNTGRGVDLQTGSGPTTIGGTLAVQRNVISGNGDDGVVAWGSDDNIIIGNYIGTDVTGLASGAGIGNGADGIAFGNGSARNQIGQPGAGNVFSGNDRDGIEIDDDSPNNVIQGNYVGVGRDGTTALGNGRHGVVLYNGANLTQIGGTAAGEENVISSNVEDGIVIDGNSNVVTANNVIAGNYIGTDFTGLLPRGNGDDGISLFAGANNTTIGGVSTSHRNIIADNGDYGIDIQGTGTDHNIVSSNYIGVDRLGTTDMGNTTDGVAIRNGSQNNVIGGLTVGERNIIAGNDNDGIWITGSGTDGNTVQGNWIGYGSDGSAIANSFHGIGVENGAGSNLVGGTSAGASNRIGNSEWDGVAIGGSGSGNSILGNSIVGNVGLGIDFENDGVTPNDAGDGDSGANDLLNFPAITSATETAGTITVDYDLDIPAGNYRIEFFTNPSGPHPSGHGEGETFQHTATITHTGSGTENFSTTFTGTAGDVITATTTQDLGAGNHGSTSEFAAAIAASGTAITVNSTGDAADASPGNGICDTGATNSEGDTECTLRAAIEEANAASVGSVDFAIPASDPGESGGVWTFTPATAYPEITQTVSIDASTQTGFSGAPVVELDGSALGAISDHGLHLGVGSDTSSIRGLAIVGFGGAGLFLEGSDDHTITANHLGVGADGDTISSNRYGMYLSGSSSNSIGGATATDRNVMSGNSNHGIAIYNSIPLGLDSLDNSITGNYIGTDSTGVLDRGNGRDGVFVVNGSSRTLVGGSGAGEGNVISANTDAGVYVGSGSMVDTVVAGNLIGVSVDETVELPNGLGVEVTWSQRTVVRDNIIGSSSGHAVILENADEAVVAGNTIGTDSAGVASWTVAGHGVFIENTSQDNTIGGTTSADANIIRGVDLDGIAVLSTAGTGNSALRNAISGSGGLAIDLDDDGVTPNSNADAWLDHPTITSADVTSGTVTVNFDLDVPAGDYHIEAFTNPSGADPTGYGEGEVYQATTTVAHSGSGVESFQITFPGAAGALVSLTATEESAGPSFGATSEFSTTVTVARPVLAVNSTGDASDTSPGDGSCDTGALNSAGATECTLRAAVEEANVSGAHDIEFNMPTTESGHSFGVWTIAPLIALPDVSVPVSIDGSTQPGWATTPVVHLDGAALTSTDAIRLTPGSDGSEVRSLAIGNFTDGNAVDVLSDDNTIAANHLGVDPSGLLVDSLGATAAVLIDGGSGNTIGGPTSLDGNVIGGANNGILVRNGSSDTQIANNSIGVDITGNAPLALTFDAIRVETGSINTIIGGSAGRGNRVGQVGDDAVQIQDETTDDVTVSHNTIGIGADGSTRFTIGDEGIEVLDGADDVTITDNVLGNTSTNAIRVDGASTNVVIQRNIIGTNTSKTNDHPVGDGIDIEFGVTGALVGGATPGDGNEIRNTGFGSAAVKIEDAATDDVAILGNILDTDLGAIDLGDDGITPNDPGDVDSGPNDLLNHPTLAITNTTGSGPFTVDVDVTLDAPAGDYRIEIYSNGEAAYGGAGKAEVFEHALSITHTGGGAETFPTTFTGSFTALSATATEDLGGGTYGSTSELSPISTAPVTAVVNSTGAFFDSDLNDGVCDTGFTNSEGDAECTLQAAVDQTNRAPNSSITFAIPNSDPGYDADGFWTIGSGASLELYSPTLALDASTQAGYDGSRPLVYVDDGDSGGDTFRVRAADVTMTGLAIGNPGDDGIQIEADRATIDAVWIGIDPEERPADGSSMGNEGIIVYDGSNDFTISSSRLTQMDTGLSSNSGTMTGTITSTEVFANRNQGVLFNNLGTISLLGNSIHDNDGLGFELGDTDGVPLANDAGDVDSGPNERLNHPALSLNAIGAGTLDIDFDLDVPAGTYRIEFFDNARPDPTGFGEGETFLSAETVVHPGGIASYSATIVGAEPDVITATTTEDLGGGIFGGTSEFSEALAVGVIFVNSTGDAGDLALGDGSCSTGGTNTDGFNECTLRAAMEEAVSNTDVDHIHFAIPESEPGFTPGSPGFWTVGPATALPFSTDISSIDASTQPGWVDQPLVQVDGALVADVGADGFRLDTGMELRGLSVTRWNDDGAHADTDDATISANWFGIAPDGTPQPNGSSDVVLWVSADGATIGGPNPADGNVFAAGGSQDGLQITTNAANVTVQNNLFGVAADGTTALGTVTAELVAITDDVTGVTISGNVFGNSPQAAVAIVGNATDVSLTANTFGTDVGLTETFPVGSAVYADSTGDATFGGTAPTDWNIVRNAINQGITLSPTFAGDFTYLGNSMRDSGALGIDLNNGDGVTLNDPGDGDTGSNDLLNFPAITSVVETGGNVRVAYDLDVPAGTYRVEAFSNPGGPHATGYGEGEVFESAMTVLHAGAGAQSHEITFPGSIGDLIALTTTEDLGAGAFGATSEFSQAVQATDPAVYLNNDRSTRRSDLANGGGLSVTAAGEAGQAGRAVRFDGTNDRLVGPAVDITDSALTMLASFSADTIAGDPRLLSKRNGAASAIYELSIDTATGEVVADVRTGAGSASARGGTVTTGTWHQALASWDGAELVLHVDGVEVDRVSLTGTLLTDVGTDLVVGNTATNTAPFDGLIDDIRVLHRALDAATAEAFTQNQTALGFVAVGAEQTGSASPWTVSGTQTRSGSFALTAPNVANSGAAAWAVATDIDEPGLVFESWWWFSTDTGIDLASGVRAGAAPTDQYEAALTSPTGWELRQRAGGSSSFDAPAAGTPTTGSWVHVEMRTDQLGDSRLFVDGVEVITSTPQGSALLLSGSMALRAGLLPGGQNWFIDDARGRKLVTPEPIATVSSLDRN